MSHYALAGDSVKEWRREASLRGPHVPHVGTALASATINIIPVIETESGAFGCRVSDSSRVAVRARVVLPRISATERGDSEVRSLAEDLDDYLRAHEATHVSIAHEYAGRIERRMKALPSESNCFLLSLKLSGILSEERAEHRRVQLRFDFDERSHVIGLLDETLSAGEKRKRIRALLDSLEIPGSDHLSLLLGDFDDQPVERVGNLDLAGES